jgi:diadenylate cyclase
MNSLIAFLSEIRWQDIVDILLNGYILFRLYVLFRGTNVLRVIAGLALLWIFQRFSLGLGLIVTSWAMQGIIAGAALIIIIVFRNEIRNVLQAKNLRALLWDFPQKRERTPIDRIVEGVYELARNRIGALIVVQGKEDLDETVQGGVDWQGQISREMLVAVFWNGNPVHDGAALINGDRITRAACILPLTSREDLPGYFGTRHRAAIGLAEKSDAMVIVVSEERGEVTVAKNSDILPVQDNLALARLLRSHLSSPVQDAPVAKKEKMELGIAAAICMVCMAVVWFSFARGMDTLTSIEVPLEYMNRDPRMQVVSTSDNVVRLYLSGSGTLIGSMRADQVRVKLDLSMAKNGENRFPITNDSIVIPPGVRLNRIEPSEIKLVLDIPVTKTLPVQVDWVDALPENLIMESLKVKPEKVTVEGPGHLLSGMDTLYTQPVSLRGLADSGQLGALLALETPTVKVAPDSSDEVQIRYTIHERAGQNVQQP